MKPWGGREHRKKKKKKIRAGVVVGWGDGMGFLACDFFYLFFLGGWGHNYMHACCLILVIVIPLELLIVMHSRSNYAADVLR